MIRGKKFLYIFFLFSVILTGFFVSFEVSFAQDEDKIELKNEDRQKIWQAVKQGLIDELIEISTSSDFKIEDQAVFVIMGQAIKADIANYLLFEVPKQIATVVIKTTLKLTYSILAGDPSIIIGEIEKLTVKEAKEYAMDWLLQKEIKTISGNLKEIFYPDYDNIWQKEVFPYIIVYHQKDLNSGEVAIEIYSSKTIRTPYPSRNYRWEGGIEELPPFILRIKGEIIENNDAYSWVKGSEIEVVFDEPVPEIEFEEQGFLGKKVAEYKSDINKIEKALENFLVIFGKSGQVVKDKVKVILDKIGTVFSWFDLFGAKISPDLGFFEQEEVGQIGQEEEEIEGIEEIEEKEIIEEGIGGPEELTLEEAQEILDNIAERIDILSQKVTELVGESEGIGGLIEPIEELEEEELEEEELEEEELEELEEKKEEGICVVNINTASKEELEKIIGVGSVIAQKIIEARPFSSIYDLVRVSGIGEITLQKIVNQGCVYVEHLTGGGGGGGGSSSIKKEECTKNSVEINTVSQEELEELTGVGPTIAGEIIKERPFSSIDDLMRVSGIGEVKLQNIKNQECAYVDESLLAPEDVTSPQIVFELESIQTSLSFEISWIGVDPIGNATPSGMETFYLQYNLLDTATPSLGQVLQYQDEEENWQDWDIAEILEFGEQKNSLALLGKDVYAYYFQIQARDKAGNLSDWQGATTTIELPKTVIISEVQIADDEFIELYNYGEQDINVSNLFLSYFSSERDWNNPWRNKKFPDDSIILAGSYYLVGLEGYPEEGGNPNSDWQIYNSSQLADKAGAVAIFPWDPKTKDSEQAKQGRIDAVGWGEVGVKEENPASSPAERESIERKELGLDTNDNSQDFQINETPSPTNSKGETFSLPSYSEAPWPMFWHDAQNTGRSSFVGPGDSENPELKALIEGDYFGPLVIDSSGILYFGGKIQGREGLYAFYPNGMQKWFYEAPLPSGSSLIGIDGTIYFLSRANKTLVAINPDNKLKWEKSFTDIAPQGQLIRGDDGTIYLLADAELVALNSITGEIIWTYKIEGNLGGGSSPTVGKNGTIYFGAQNTLYAVNPDGTKKWERIFSPHYEWAMGVPNVNPPSIGDDGTIYVIVSIEKDWRSLTNQGVISCFHALDPEDPFQERWDAKCSGDDDRFSAPPIISSTGNIYFTGHFRTSTNLFGYDSQGNDLGWSYYQGFPAILSLVDKEEMIYGLFGYGSKDSKVKAFNKNGEEKWSITLDSSGAVSLCLGGDGDLFVSGKEKLYIIK